MARKGFAPWLAAVGLLFAVGHFVAAPQRVAATVNCCVFPTQEAEAAVGTDPADPDAGAFQMALSDPQGTDFAANFPDESGEVGEWSWKGGDDTCYDYAENNLHISPVNLPPQFTSVSTPAPTYWWDVGQLGYCANTTCQPGALNAVVASYNYNMFGYDSVGYSTAQVNYYHGLAGMAFPCAAYVYQQMDSYCPLTNFWAPYAYNDLLAEIESDYVVDCKNSVCETIY